jgi:hypothetical protein
LDAWKVGLAFLLGCTTIQALTLADFTEFAVRESHASISVNGQIVGQCGHGLCILAGVRVGDTEAETK